ncbi:MAG: Metallo-beta-lactamase [uncultured bacterium]|nr:MAG: Metallo-beta-lactamase [uncultured bacterium]
MILNQIKIEGISIAGEETNIRMPKLGIMFDIGKCPEKAVSIPNLLITHGHVDHIGGIAHYLFARTIKKMTPPHIYAPPSLIPPIKQIVRIFADIHKSDYPANYHSMELNEFHNINKKLFIKVIPASHTIPTYCYLLYKTKKDNPFLSFTGDTTIEILENNPLLYKSGILMIECTFFGDKKQIEKADAYHHIHIDQILERAKHFKNEYIVLCHKSPRYSKKMIVEELKKKTPAILKNRLLVF